VENKNTVAVKCANIVRIPTETDSALIWKSANLLCLTGHAESMVNICVSFGSEAAPRNLFPVKIQAKVDLN
jgi:hypothetical protein